MSTNSGSVADLGEMQNVGIEISQQNLRVEVLTRKYCYYKKRKL